MPAGTVKWFNNSKGFGFIVSDDQNEDIFAHYSTIQMEGYRTLKAGQAVEFDIKETDTGLHALNIRSPELEEVSSAETVDTQPCAELEAM
jgi:cold shock protein